MLGRGREAAGGHLQQFHGAHAGAAAHRDHREERAVGDGLLEVGDQDGLVDGLATEVALHQRLVLRLLDDPLDQAAAVLAEFRGVGVVRRMDGAVPSR